MNFIHLFAAIAIWLASYYPGLDIILSLLYLFVISMEAGITKEKWEKKKILLSWQGPAMILSLLSIAGLQMADLSNLSFFLLEFWFTPVIPLLSLINPGLILDHPFYYYLLLLMPVLLSAYYYILPYKTTQ